VRLQNRVPFALVAAAALASFAASTLLQGLERRGFDARLALRRDAGWPADLALVRIDDPTLNKAGRWPWPRGQFGAFLEAVHAQGPKTIVADVILGAPSTPEADAALARSIAITHPVLPAAGVADSTGETAKGLREALVPVDVQPPAGIPPDHVMMPMEAFAKGAAGIGHAVFYPDVRDGQVRGHTPLLSVVGEKGALPSTALLGFLLQRGHRPGEVTLGRTSLTIPGGPVLRLHGGAFALDLVPGGRLPASISAGRILAAANGDAAAQKEARAALEGKLALVYVDSVYTPDLFSSPLAARTTGGVLIATAMRTFDTGRTPEGVPLFPTLSVLLLLALAAAPSLSRRTAATTLGVGAGAIAAWGLIACALVPATDLFLHLTEPTLFLVLASGALTGWAGRVAEADRVQMRALLDSVKRAYAEDATGERATVAKHGGELPTRIGARVEPKPMSQPTDPRLAGARPPPTESRDAELGVGTETRRGSNAATTRSGAEALVGGRALEEPVQIGQYEVQRELGRGGMGAIFLAIDRDLDRPVAIKILESATKDTFVRFRREAMAVARISHPNVVQIYEVGLDSKVPFIVMEYVAGGTLSDLLRDPDSPSPLPWDRAARIVAGVARGLGAAHMKGIVHRDMKPANVLLVSRKHEFPKIADFGIAKLSGAEQLTREGLVVGTVGYLSPEQALGKTVDPRSDVYSLAVMFYRMITGERAFEGTTEEMLRASVTRGIPDPRDVNPSIPGPLAELVLRMGSLDPQPRPKDGNVVATALDLILEQAAGAPAPTR